jgi:hypothetical protein
MARRPLAQEQEPAQEPARDRGEGDDTDDERDDQAALAILMTMHRLAAMPQYRFHTRHELREMAERSGDLGGTGRPYMRTAPSTAVDPSRVNRSFAFSGHSNRGK